MSTPEDDLALEQMGLFGRAVKVMMALRELGVAWVPSATRIEVAHGTKIPTELLEEANAVVLELQAAGIPRYPGHPELLTIVELKEGQSAPAEMLLPSCYTATPRRRL